LRYTKEQAFSQFLEGFRGFQADSMDNPQKLIENSLFLQKSLSGVPILAPETPQNSKK
jgi:hypothetical protein